MAGWNEPEEEKFVVYVGDDKEVEVSGAITADKIKEIARANGIKNMGVRSTNGNVLSPEDFPVSQNIILFQVNKAGAGWNEPEQPTFTVYVGDDKEVSVTGAITSDKVKEIARANGIKNMGVRSTDGNVLSPEDFPVSQNIILFQVNKAGQAFE